MKIDDVVKIDNVVNSKLRCYLECVHEGRVTHQWKTLSDSELDSVVP